MKVDEAGESMRVTPPTHRFDITREVDLVEEVARVHGYEAVPAVSLRGELAILPVSESNRSALSIKNIMVTRGYQEVITYSFISEEVDRDFRSEGRGFAFAEPDCQPDGRHAGFAGWRFDSDIAA
jgi:phenylalanyl-tRNA synthetase beta chain